MCKNGNKNNNEKLVAELVEANPFCHPEVSGRQAQ